MQNITFLTIQWKSHYSTGHPGSATRWYLTHFPSCLSLSCWIWFRNHLFWYVYSLMGDRVVLVFFLFYLCSDLWWYCDMMILWHDDIVTWWYCDVDAAAVEEDYWRGDGVEPLPAATTTFITEIPRHALSCWTKTQEEKVPHSTLMRFACSQQMQGSKLAVAESIL